MVGAQGLAHCSADSVLADRCGRFGALEAQTEISAVPAPVLMHPDTITDYRRELTTQRNALHPKDDIEKQIGFTILVNRIELMLKYPDDEQLHATFPDLMAAHVLLHEKIRVTRRAITGQRITQ